MQEVRHTECSSFGPCQPWKHYASLELEAGWETGKGVSTHGPPRTCSSQQLKRDKEQLEKKQKKCDANLAGNRNETALVNWILNQNNKNKSDKRKDIPRPGHLGSWDTWCILYITVTIYKSVVQWSIGWQWLVLVSACFSLFSHRSLLNQPNQLANLFGTHLIIVFYRGTIILVYL